MFVVFVGFFVVVFLGGIFVCLFVYFVCLFVVLSYCVILVFVLFSTDRPNCAKFPSLKCAHISLLA